MSNKVKCEICGEECDAIQLHLKEKHPEISLADYREQYPNAPILSDRAKKLIKAKQEKANMAKASPAATKPTGKRPFHEVFDLDKGAAGVMSSKGNPIPISVLADRPDGDEIAGYVPDLDPNYVFDVDTLKTAVMGLECEINTYICGHAGTGKSTIVEQICHRTNRPMLRVQHTVNTEESHVVGQYVVKDGATVWEPGPLQFCMMNGLVYLADEYDRALPMVLSLYQPVLEGKPLVTKEAPPEWRIVKPHPDFRIIATGNTNGSGDETGLYPSTALQDFANYERFGIMLYVSWMSENLETEVVAGQAQVPQADARQLVKYATDIRKQVEAGQISSPISPRALINAAKLGLRLGSYRKGLTLAFTNRLPSVDAEACGQIAQRMFG